MHLRSQLDHLDRTLLGTITTEFPDPLTNEERAQAHAYLVLAHAVLEEYIEGVFERHYDRLASWLTEDMVPLESVRLVYAVSEWLPTNLNVDYKKRSIHGVVSVAARKHFVTKLNANHGLKSENIETLAKWTGLDWVAFSNSLNTELLDLKTLGVKRGAASHLSPYTDKATSLTAVENPDDIRGWVDAGRKAAEAIENYLDKLVKKQEPSSLIADWDGN